MAPLLLIAISLAGLVFGADAARGEVFGELRGLLGSAGAAAVEQVLASLNWPAGGVLATLAGLGLMFVGATTVFAELQDAMDRIWRVPAATESGLRHVARTRLLSFALVLGVGLLLIVSLVLNAALAALEGGWASALHGWSALLDGLDSATSWALPTLLFAMVYKGMPRVRIAWSDVWLGAVVTALLFQAGRRLIGLYLGHAAVTSGFGAAGSLVVVLVWVYYSAQIFLFGAELSAVIARRRSARRCAAVAQAADSVVSYRQR